MKRNQERRATGIQRVGMQKLVEMCGLDPSVTPAFEAESVDVSGRGIHVRTAYLPPVGAQLVCRFEDRGREIIAEGRVAWRNEKTRGGEFGLMFTALDSGSVDVLRELTGMKSPDAELSEAAEAEAHEGEGDTRAPAAPAANDPGSRVRLHIDGLGAPMKALVKNSSRSRVKVGSNLEFLKVGRQLEIENLERGARRQASIDGIDVVIDPQSGVPQLVVALHYADVVDVTPEPSVIDETPLRSREPAAEDRHRSSQTVAAPPKRRPQSAPVAAPPAALADDDVGPSPEDRELLGSEARELEGATASRKDRSRASDSSDDLHGGEYDGEDDELDARADRAASDSEDEAAEFRGRFAVMANQAGDWVKGTSSVLAQWGTGAAGGLGSWLRSARHRGGSAQGSRSEPAARRRVTSAPVSVSGEGRRLRPQSSAGRGASAPSNKEPAVETDVPRSSSKRIRRLAGGIAAVALTGTVLAIAVSRPASPPGADAEVGLSSVTVADGSKRAGSDGQRSATGTTPVGRLREPAPATSGAIADVPLFGPTPMATLEPAPLDAPPATAPGAPPALGPASDDDDDQPPVAEAIPVARASGTPNAVPDEVFERAAASRESKPEEVKPWGRGKLSTPTVYRLRLDGPGMAINGSVTSTGFAVIVPGRKVLETAEGISKRDKRFAKVAAKNQPGGALISFAFRDGVPGYRVRLRRDFVEFLVSAPGA